MGLNGHDLALRLPSGDTNVLLDNRELTMTVGKATALTTAFVGVFALGLALGPSVKDRFWSGNRQAAAPAAEFATDTTTKAPAAAPAPAKQSRPDMARAKKSAPPANRATPAPSATIAASEPRLHDRLRPVLNRGARMDIAAEGFRSAEEFATVAHAAHNTQVPFMVLKHRVLSENRSLANAIQQTKPELDAKAEVERARAQAKSDVEALRG
jgi:hypothetical protein